MTKERPVGKLGARYLELVQAGLPHDEIVKNMGGDRSSVGKIRRRLVGRKLLDAPVMSAEEQHQRNVDHGLITMNSLWPVVSREAMIRKTSLEIRLTLLAEKGLDIPVKRIRGTLGRGRKRITPYSDEERADALANVKKPDQRNLPSRVKWWSIADRLLDAVPQEARPSTRMEWMLALGYLYVNTLESAPKQELFIGMSETDFNNYPPRLAESFRVLEQAVNGKILVDVEATQRSAIVHADTKMRGARKPKAKPTNTGGTTEIVKLKTFPTQVKVEEDPVVPPKYVKILIDYSTAREQNKAGNPSLLKEFRREFGQFDEQDQEELAPFLRIITDSTNAAQPTRVSDSVIAHHGEIKPGEIGE